MNYYIDLFSPETAKAFESSNKDISGFRISRKTYVNNMNIGPGDRFICYVTKLQRLVGVLEIKSKPFQDDKPIFMKDNDPFVLRFNVQPIVWLPLEKAIPLHEDFIWNTLSFTKGLAKTDNSWTWRVFGSPNHHWPKEDCIFLEKILLEQAQKQVDYPFSEDDLKKMKTPKMRIGKKEEIISIPEEETETIEEETKSSEEQRESIKAQAKLAEIGEKFGFKIWLPNPDRARVLTLWKPKEGILLDELPFSYEDNFMKTVKLIDVLWIRNRMIVRAFEVEDKTSIYSGILRMADLLTLAPNFEIKLYIVAPSDRREKVFNEIKRPVFAGLEKGPLRTFCKFIPYEALDLLIKDKKLRLMKDDVIDEEEYSQYVEE